MCIFNNKKLSSIFFCFSIPKIVIFIAFICRASFCWRTSIVLVRWLPTNGVGSAAVLVWTRVKMAEGKSFHLSALECPCPAVESQCPAC